MNDKNRDELKELCGRFYDAAEAGRIESEIQQGDELLRKYAAPEPDEMLIYNIKAGIAEALSRKQTNHWRAAMGKAIAVAAAFIIVSVVSVRLFENLARHEATPVSIASADSEFEIAGAQFAMLIDEVDEIEGKLRTLRFGEDRLSGYDESAEIETELIESDFDFWKG